MKYIKVDATGGTAQVFNACFTLISTGLSDSDITILIAGDRVAVDADCGGRALITGIWIVWNGPAVC